MSTWFEEATRVLAKVPNVSIDDKVAFFNDRPRIAIRVQSLDGYGFIHEQTKSGHYSLCVFESSQSDSSEFVEVFERRMSSLTELPEHITAWQKFRSNCSVSNIAKAQAAQSKIIEKSWRWKQKYAALFQSTSSQSIGERLEALGIDVDIPSLGKDWPTESQARLKQDLNSIVPELLAWHLPCDDTGQWFLKRRAPLFRYDYDKRRMLDACLVVVLPEKRSDRARLTTDWLNADSQSIRLDATPEYFDSRAMDNFIEKILGGLHKVSVSTNGKRAKRHDSTETTLPSKAAHLLELQSSGKFAEACELAGLELDDSIEACLAAKRVSHMCTCCAELDEQLTAWSEQLKQTLLSLNLAALAPQLIRDQNRRARPRKEPIPILSFPLQRHTRKANFAIDIRNPGKPRLTIETTGSIHRVPISIWRRPIELDALQQRIADLSHIPKIIRKQFGWE